MFQTKLVVCKNGVSSLPVVGCIAEYFSSESIAEKNLQNFTKKNTKFTTKNYRKKLRGFMAFYINLITTTKI